MELGVEIAQRAEKITGIPTVFGAGVTGPYGAVAWISAYESIQAVEAAQQALASDADWVSFIDKKVTGVYVDDPDTTQQRVYRRIG
jgi:hypothetical protein